ncbi:MAG: ABC transporter ATP-binding protein [Candidatus Electryonea clarkiae]|nr:ABC transporter ATP-binding protein [Candidatus Electryonea clarkiae]
MQLFRQLLPYYKPYQIRIFSGLVFILLANAFKVAVPWVMRDAINGLEENISTTYLWNSALIIVGIAIISGFFRFLMRKTVIGVSRDMEFDLRRDLFRHLLRLEPAFYDRSRIGDLMTRLTSDIERVRMVIGPALMYTVNTFFGLAFGLTLMMLINPGLSLYVFLIVPVVAVIVFVVGKRIHTASVASQEALSDISSMIQQNLSGIRVIQSFRQEKNQETIFEDKNKSYFKKSFKITVLQGIFFPTIMLIFGAAVAGIILFGGRLIIEGKLRIGDFVAFMTYLMILAWPIVSIGWVVALVQQGGASLKRLMKIFDRMPELYRSPNPSKIKNPSGRISFKNVTLTYPRSEKPSLEDVSFEISPGCTLGIVGRIGSGKSTIISALVRLYDLDKGQIYIDDYDINDLSLNDLRECFGVVPQDPILFSTTIRENITLGNDNYTMADIQKAIEISRLSQDLNEFPNGLDTEVGERGITLSGGQKQRVAIARAVIRKPPVIILDDALSAVDSDTEEKIISNLKKYLKNRTAIIVTHRISSVRDAEKIIVLDEGSIVESGRHDELVKREGIYAELFHKHLVVEELEDTE